MDRTMTQGHLFPDSDYTPTNAAPIARNTDPSTSHEAADEITQSGKRANQKMLVLSLVRRFPLRTSAELSRLGNVDRHMVARRLPDLAGDLMVVSKSPRKCSVTGYNALVWEVA